MIKRDPDQQAAIEVRRNAVVSAGAGSGKTSVLTDRYVRLVRDERVPVARILALTFTRKAAAEMYDRIHRALAGSDDPFVRQELAQFEGAVIATLDSFCAAIARNGSARFGIPATFSIDEVVLAERAEQLALAFLVEHADDPVIADLIRLNGFARLWKEGLAALAVRRFSLTDEADSVARLAAQLGYLRAECRRHEAELRRIVAALGELPVSGKKSLQTAASALAAFREEIAFPDDPEQSDLDAVSASRTEIGRLASMRLPGSNVKDEALVLLREHLVALKKVAPLYSLVLLTLSRWSDHVRLTDLIERFRQRIIGEKRRLGLLSYHDVTALAIATLTADRELRSWYKERFRAVMIDEFQDNNEEQKRLLYLLSERADRHETGLPEAADLDPAKLFFVGDEKQSIYRFRGADVSVFRSLAAELAPSAEGSDSGADLRLGANYRSEPGLIRFFNTLFSHVFAEATEGYEARYESLRWRDGAPGLVPRVELWEVEKRPARDETMLDDADSEAFHIAEFIRRAVAEQSLPVGDGVDADGVQRPPRPARYGDFAILLRSSANQIRLERMLRRFAVPYVSQSPRSLFLEAPAYDIYHVLQLALHPDDRAAYAGYLRSPLVGLSDEGVVRQLLSGGALLESCDGLDEDDRRRIRLGKERYDEICRLADARPITELLHRIWHHWGYRYHLLREQGHVPYLEYYDLFWELAHSFEERGLAAFLDEVRSHLGQNEKLEELELVRREEDGVQIMTIHKSKGLEFPVVIVANAGNRGRSESVAAAPWYASGDFGVVFNTGVLLPGEVREKPANYLFAREAETHRAQDLAELKRLLYVAATRAESHLIVSGELRSGDGDDRKTTSLMDLFDPPFARVEEELPDDPAAPVEITRRGLPPVPQEQERRAHARTGRRSIGALAERYAGLPVVERAYEPDEVTATELNARALESNAASAEATRAAEGVDAVTAPEHPVDAILSRYDLAATFGSYCHYCVEHAAELQAGPPASHLLPTALRPEVAAPPIEASEASAFLELGWELARGFLDSPLGREVASLPVEHELAFLLDAGAVPDEAWQLAGWDSSRPRLVRGQIDLVAERDDRVLVVDFKSDRVLLPHHYRVQMLVYRAAARALFGRPAEVRLFSLRTGRAVEVSF